MERKYYLLEILIVPVVIALVGILGYLLYQLSTRKVCRGEG